MRLDGGDKGGIGGESGGLEKRGRECVEGRRGLEEEVEDCRESGSGERREVSDWREGSHGGRQHGMVL